MEDKKTIPEKPIMIAKEEFCEKITKNINESGIPLFIIEYILKDILNDVHNINRQILENEKVKYESELKNVNGKR